MNIYFLDRNPWIAAQNLHDRHVRACTIDIACILSSVWRNCWSSKIGMTEAEHLKLYGIKPRSLASPLVLWAGGSSDNYKWVMDHLDALVLERKLRWPLLSFSDPSESWRHRSLPLMVHKEFTAPPQLVAESCQAPDFIKAYRSNYKYFKLLYYSPSGKRPIPNCWTKRGIPKWLAEL